MKVEAQNITGDRFTYWIEIPLIKPLTEDKKHYDDIDHADFLTEEGQLKHQLTIEVEEFKFYGVNTNVQMILGRTINFTSLNTGQCTNHSYSKQ